jgi:hypothetical protein
MNEKLCHLRQYVESYQPLPPIALDDELFDSKNQLPFELDLPIMAGALKWTFKNGILLPEEAYSILIHTFALAQLPHLYKKNFQSELYLPIQDQQGQPESILRRLCEEKNSITNDSAISVQTYILHGHASEQLLKRSPVNQFDEIILGQWERFIIANKSLLCAHCRITKWLPKLDTQQVWGVEITENQQGYDTATFWGYMYDASIPKNLSRFSFCFDKRGKRKE